MTPVDMQLSFGPSSPRQRRSQSIGSDRPSSTGYVGLLSPPVNVSPDPAFIAASAASQIVTNDHDSQADAWFDQHGIEPSGETALVTPPALKLVNRFLDQLLFGFLSVSRSTSLASLRPAVAEILKPKLAKDAISGADQELHEYLGGGEEEELVAFHNGLEPSGDWDLELVWKRTRLRCMVYSSLGDMEEEDEDYYTEQEHLDGPPGSTNRFSNNPGVVSPAVAIFLTSILEFMGEQVLVVAGQAAYHKLRAKHEREEQDGASTPADIAERVVVEETDMEKVALDRTLGRLWRGWKKRIRSPTTSISMRRFSRESLRSQVHATRAVSTPTEDSIEENARRPSLAAVLAEHEHAASIPLPMNDNDVREIEIPGLASRSDDEEECVSTEEEIFLSPRRKTMADYQLLTAIAAHPHTPTFLTSTGRKRSNSLPLPTPSLHTSPKRYKPASEITEEAGTEKVPVEAEAKDAEMANGAVAPVDEVNEKEADEKDKENSHKGLIAGMVASATAIGAAAVASIVAAAHGEAPPQSENVAEEIDPEEEFTEEPEIMTSSRVSLPPAGRISPDENDKDPKELSRRSSIRSQSVHSLRLIDVGPARSPGISRSGSVGSRPASVSRPSSIHSPVVVEALAMASGPRNGRPVSRGPTSSPIARNGSGVSTRHPRSSAEDSISEVEERDVSRVNATPVTAVPADLAAAMQGVDLETTPTSQQFASDSVNGNSQGFVLSAPPASRHLKDVANRSPADQNLQPATTSFASRSLSGENGAPPLTPLREMMEGAQDTSDEGSMLHGNEARDVDEPPLDYIGPSIVRNPEYQHLVQGPGQGSKRNSPPRTSNARKSTTEPTSAAQRSIHTSGSGSSSASIKTKPVRTSGELGQKEDKGQSFEQLIRSDQTIQYTLTPQNMRDIESPESPRHAVSNVPDVRPPSIRSHSSSVTKYTSIHSNSIADGPKSVKSPFKPTSRPLSSTGSRLRSNAPQPREARVERDSMGDFAEFIRSTGPAQVYEPSPLRTTAAAHRGMNGTARNASGSAMSSTTTVTLPRRAESSSGRNRLQAREATVPRGDSISDLIDFVRSGPQLDKEGHRIPRTVAPFRTTMDSDQMSGAVGGKATDASLPDTRYSQSQTTVSADGSVNSQSALIKKNASRVLPPQNQHNTFDEEDMMPKRKTRRARDPYAIDLSDEDEEYEPIRKPKVQEESLADFLRNVPPPPEISTTSVFEGVPKPPSNNYIRKKSSSPGLMARFGRSNSSPNIAADKSSVPPLPKAPAYTPIAAQYSTTYGQNSNGHSSNGNNYASQLDNSRNKVAQKQYQPREASYADAPRTNDLADFLLRSEPPSSMQIQPQTFAPTLQKEEVGTFQRMFGRKKAH